MSVGFFQSAASPTLKLNLDLGVQEKLTDWKIRDFDWVRLKTIEFSEK
jgi:hypothetical protein